MPIHDNDRHAVVLDVGRAYTKCGFVGENEPRVIIPSKLDGSKKGEGVYLHEYSNEKELHFNLVKFLHHIFFKYLLVNHRERRIVIVESLLCPTEFREILANVLFVHFEVPSVLFVPSHLVTLYTLGINTAFVIDIGHEETTMIPVCEGTPLIHAWQAQPLGAKAIQGRLESLLLLRAKVQGSDGQKVDLVDVIPKLSRGILEDIVVRTCFVTTLPRSRQLVASRTNEAGPSPPVPPPTILYPLSGNNNLTLDGSVREESAEVLFETDNEMVSLASMILDSILASPIDFRIPLAENLVIIGGGSMMPGLKSRLVSEVKDLQQHPKYLSRIALKALKVHRPPAKSNYAAWLGGAILGATEAIATRSYTREVYLQTNHVPDWNNLADNTKEIDSRAG
ncbi:hypothetical protein DAPPUDRAFT_308104 [Daphnia pulex]|uniref:Actin-related protein 10 n=1 Tax=Daphnia pulex TaxID=6669 RepID=E9H6E7_DAPPU|nr:hypothetical protein DAPPUDRAFT_308104 [Daphnia pulex]|eukprot:EFX72709.1 hypothetical protein DAPPUDRAFT_308104 [Daphnia pulex]